MAAVPSPTLLDRLVLAPISTVAPLQSGTQFHNTTSLQLAVKQNTLGVGYAGAGFLLFYYVGVSKVLQQLGVIKPGHTKIAGASAGILSAAVDYGFVSHDEFIKLGKDFAARCRANYNCAGTLGDEVVRMADKVMPADAHIRLSNMSVAYMALSTPAGRVGIPEGDYVTKFKSRQDLMDAVHAGVYVPLWSGPDAMTKFRNETTYDGAYRSPMPCPTGNTTYCIKMSVLPPWTTAEVLRDAMDPRVWPELLQVLNVTTKANPVRFFLEGIRNRVMQPDQHFGKLAAAGYTYVTLQARLHQLAGGVDIWPGKWAKNKFSIVRWMLMVLTPPTPDVIDEIVQMGIDDGHAWARDMGLEPPFAKAAPAKKMAAKSAASTPAASPVAARKPAAAGPAPAPRRMLI
ncbi:hypothetical protein MNEG_3337 [Monoraphidium neglectum]|uniref:PNPLA domain-containing protein n=1 Tax=Monoraphidium neglectum TaxID=145388 RepID=A0A0D2MVW2_9CHLO|nr:hypothetical protein MNEG_3337 [Monoraphidium neglectum]KIZ04622.1 hypothetical protein MNEG_3337 [Monoraphidium neglectum]|eukprot:XP_013903641.1 hypothetical protein MNEG_3337 [Monoraphidium neglectum]